MKGAALLTLSMILLSPISATHIHAMDRQSDQNQARNQMKSGKVKSLREIEGIVIPRMGGAEYLGPEYDSIAQVYRLKFIDKGRVIFVDVDARTGQILQRR
ncbi:hypothetical protein LPB140_06595 [Sphingorhabdus lutea]|uniref:PepSY domain-containing protein n=2 Tax=Sphingorhabdus lutea TaxID=1913578 RepID=A0A1L3JEX3_9SPHN|nr:hypothetical protein LPB140_06595 [Sphingorhabdus lutea]